MASWRSTYLVSLSFTSIVRRLPGSTLVICSFRESMRFSEALIKVIISFIVPMVFLIASTCTRPRARDLVNDWHNERRWPKGSPRKLEKHGNRDVLSLHSPRRNLVPEDYQDSNALAEGLWPATSWGCITPQAVTHSLVLLKMGKIISRNMLS